MSVMSTPLMTVAEFMNRPQTTDGSKEELVRGRIVKMPAPQAEHGILQLEVGSRLLLYVKKQRLGWVVTESGAVTEPDTVRGPDVAFYSIEDYPTRPTGYFHEPARLIVEVLSPSDRANRTLRKVNEYLAAGVRLVWVIDPEDRIVMVHQPGKQPSEVIDGQNLEGYDVLPGFSLPLAELFA
jgi:Uma2 family endonuclease